MNISTRQTTDSHKSPVPHDESSNGFTFGEVVNAYDKFFEFVSTSGENKKELEHCLFPAFLNINMECLRNQRKDNVAQFCSFERRKTFINQAENDAIEDMMKFTSFEEAKNHDYISHFGSGSSHAISLSIGAIEKLIAWEKKCPSAVVISGILTKNIRIRIVEVPRVKYEYGVKYIVPETKCFKGKRRHSRSTVRASSAITKGKKPENNDLKMPPALIKSRPLSKKIDKNDTELHGGLQPSESTQPSDPISEQSKGVARQDADPLYSTNISLDTLPSGEDVDPFHLKDRMDFGKYFLKNPKQVMDIVNILCEDTIVKTQEAPAQTSEQSQEDIVLDNTYQGDTQFSNQSNDTHLSSPSRRDGEEEEEEEEGFIFLRTEKFIITKCNFH